MPDYYSAMLDLRGRPVLIIGGDQVAVEKARGLLTSKAKVTVQSSEFCDELLEMAARDEVVLRQKAYSHGDLEGAFVVVSTSTYNPALSEEIWNEAQARNQLINIVDLPHRCNFILPSILRRGKLTISVSTEGASPALAKRIRQQLENEFPPAYEEYLRLASTIRALLREQGISYQQRDDFFGLFFESDILALLVAGQEEAALAEARNLLQRSEIMLSIDCLATVSKERSDTDGTLLS